MDNVQLELGLVKIIPSVPRGTCKSLSPPFFPMLEKEVGEMGESAKRLTAVLGVIPLVRFVPMTVAGTAALPRTGWQSHLRLQPKAVLKLGTTRQMIDRLKNDEQLRRLCGWKQAKIARNYRAPL
jgi:hypothetical protein